MWQHSCCCGCDDDKGEGCSGFMCVTAFLLNAPIHNISYHGGVGSIDTCLLIRLKFGECNILFKPHVLMGSGNSLDV